jgi:hypothetical protein
LTDGLSRLLDLQQRRFPLRTLVRRVAAANPEQALRHQQIHHCRDVDDQCDDA